MQNGQMHHAISGVEPWAVGSDLHFNFARPGSDENVVDTHAQVINALNSAGSYEEFGANALVRTDLGLQTVPTSRTNLFLNSFSPATQTITVVSSTWYTVSITGSGSITLSGAGTGTVTDGSPVVFQAGSTSLTCTVSGSPDTCNVEAGVFASPPIETSGTSVTVNGNIQNMALAGLDTGVAGIVQLDFSGTSQYQIVFALNEDGDENNDSVLFYTNDPDLVSGNLVFEVKTGGAVQAALNIGNTGLGTSTIAFVAGTNYAMARVVGLGTATADTSVTYPTVLDQLCFGGNGAVANDVFLRTKKLALWYGSGHTYDSTLFDELYAKAVIADAQ